MSRKVLHASKVTQFNGYTRTGTLCNRMTTGDDGMNIADGDEEVTCKFCLKRIAFLAFDEIGMRNAREENERSAQQNNVGGKS